MAIKKLTDISLATGVTLTDLIHIVDVTNTTQNPAGSSFKATISQVQSALSGPFGIPNTSGIYTYYSTLQAAINAATSGQTVEVFTDYTEPTSQVILKNGVNINFNGHTYTLSSSFGGVSCFIDNGIPVNCSLLNGTISRTVSTVSTSWCLYLTTASTVTTDCVFTSNRGTVRTDNTSSVIDGGKHFSLSGTSGLGVISVDGIVRNAYTDRTSSPSTNNYGIYLNSGATAYNCQVFSTGGSNLYWGIRLGESAVISDCLVDISGGFAAVTQHSGKIHNCTLKTSSATGDAVQILSAGTITNSTIISSAVNALAVQQNVRVINCDIFASAGTGIRIIQAGSVISNTSIYTLSNNGIIYETSGITDVENCTITSLTLPPINIQQSIPNDRGQFKIRNCRITSNSNVGISSTSPRPLIISNSSIESLWNNAGGHSINLPASVTGHTVVNCQLITSNTGAFGINSGAGAGVYYANNSFEGMNTSVSAGVGQLIPVATVQTNQQNITI